MGVHDARQGLDTTWCWISKPGSWLLPADAEQCEGGQPRSRHVQSQQRERREIPGPWYDAGLYLSQSRARLSLATDVGRISERPARSAMVSRRSGSAIAVAEHARMLATTRKACPMSDAREPIAPPHLSRHGRDVTEVDPCRGAVAFDQPRCSYKRRHDPRR